MFPLPNPDWFLLYHEVSYAGKKRDELRASLDTRFGEDNWTIAWDVECRIVKQRDAIQLYEDAYVEHLRKSPELLEWIVSTASDVYDTAPSNVHSRLDYSIQEGSATHLQDIALRNAIQRLGKTFYGDHLVEVRGRRSEGSMLGPGVVLFHRPEIILPRSQHHHRWWRDDSVEAFYQQNKVLCIAPQSMSLRSVSARDGISVDPATMQHYRADAHQPHAYWRISALQ